MSELEQIAERVRGLSAGELREFRAWFAEFDARAWDEQIVSDSNAGRLDALAEQAVFEHLAGRSREI